jgi:outer membrane protein
MLTVFLFSLNLFAAIDLNTAIEKSKLNMETLERSNQVISASESRKDRAIGTLAPQVHLNGSYTELDPPPGSGSSPFLRTTQYSSALNLQQPILRGGSLSAYQVANEDLHLRIFQKENDQLLLSLNVIQSYFQLIQSKKDLEHLLELEKFSQDRVREISTRAKVGKSRQGELYQAQTQLAQVEASVQEGKQNLKTSELRFKFLTGVDDDVIEKKSLPEIKEQKEYLESLTERPDSKIANQQVILADKQVSLARGGHFPNLDLSGNYFFTRTGVLQNSKWDVGLNLRFPIFQGGTVNSSLNEALANKRTAELSRREQNRNIEREVTQLYEQLVQGKNQALKLEDAVLKAQKTYQLNLADYRYGLVSNLEVLQSLNLFIETKRQYDRVFNSVWVTYSQLEMMKGRNL